MERVCWSGREDGQGSEPQTLTEGSRSSHCSPEEAASWQETLLDLIQTSYENVHGFSSFCNTIHVRLSADVLATPYTCKNTTCGLVVNWRVSLRFSTVALVSSSSLFLRLKSDSPTWWLFNSEVIPFYYTLSFWCVWHRKRESGRSGFSVMNCELSLWDLCIRTLLAFKAPFDFSHDQPGAEGLPVRLMTISWLLLFTRQTDTDIFIQRTMSWGTVLVGPHGGTMWVSAVAAFSFRVTSLKSTMSSWRASYYFNFLSWWLMGRKRWYKHAVEQKQPWIRAEPSADFQRAQVKRDVLDSS